MNDKLQIKTCPTCGSNKSKRVARDLTRNYTGRTYTVGQAAFSFRRIPLTVSSLP